MAWTRRFASLGGELLQGIKDSAKPAGGLDLAVRFVPDAVLWPAVATITAPEGSTAMERAGMGLEELATGMGTSLLFGGTGRAVGRRMAGRRGFAPRTAEYEGLENMATTVGDLAAGFTQAFTPRLVQNSTLARLYPDQPQERQELREESELREAGEGLANAMFTGGSLLLPRVSALDDVISPLALL
jgi:hypothetical protein